MLPVASCYRTRNPIVAKKLHQLRFDSRSENDNCQKHTSAGFTVAFEEISRATTASIRPFCVGTDVLTSAAAGIAFVCVCKT